MSSNSNVDEPQQSKNVVQKCPGCESRSRIKRDHFNDSINHFYEGCYLRETTCIWCGAYSWGDEYCSYQCISAERIYDNKYTNR